MAIKRTKQTPSTQQKDTARTLWLAGLGAVSIAQKRGGALLSSLAAEGQELQARTQKAAHDVGMGASTKVREAIAPLRAGLKRNAKKFGAAVQHGIAGALARLGIPSKSDIEVLTQRVTALSKQLKTAR
jgi:poly(hydroxyalkanoate) granule-associated protein